MFLTIKNLQRKKKEIEKRGAAVLVICRFGHRAMYYTRSSDKRNKLNVLRCREESAETGRKRTFFQYVLYDNSHGTI